MKLTIALDREVDVRLIGEVPELNVDLYGDTKQDAIQRAQSAARELVLDRIAHGALPPDSANAIFDIAPDFLARGRGRLPSHRTEADRRAPRPHGGLPQDHEKNGWAD